MPRVYAPRRQHLAVRLLPEDIERIDALAAAASSSRSEWLRAALSLAMSRPDLVGRGPSGASCPTCKHPTKAHVTRPDGNRRCLMCPDAEAVSGG